MQTSSWCARDRWSEDQFAQSQVVQSYFMQTVNVCMCQDLTVNPRRTMRAHPPHACLTTHARTRTHTLLCSDRRRAKVGFVPPCKPLPTDWTLQLPAASLDDSLTHACYTASTMAPHALARILAIELTMPLMHRMVGMLMISLLVMLLLLLCAQAHNFANSPAISKHPLRNRMVKMLVLPALLLLSGLTLASLTRGARAGPTSSGAFEASFSDLEKIGESNYTHFWMPAPLTLSSTLPNARLMAHVDLCVVTPCLHVFLFFSYTTDHYVVQQ
jgi:hypothetical protein